MKKYYSLAKALHLYFGLSISPIIFIFSISVLVLNHPEYFNKLHPNEELPPIQTQINTFTAQDSDLSTAKAIIQQLDIAGEIDWISKTDSTFSFPVNNPGLNKWVSVNTKTGMVTITQKDVGVFNGMTYLHTMPGQHNVMIRGNSFFMKVWKITTDTFVYIVLLVSATGIFLWYFLKPERKLGIYSLGFGLLLFFVL